LRVTYRVHIFGVCMALAFWGAYWTFGLEFRRKGIPRPFRLTDILLLYCGLTGFAGALFFAKLEDTRELFQYPLRWLVTYNGLVYYGGLIFGAITYLIITYRRGIPLGRAADIGSPGMMLAYGIGRIGCQLSGDGDWGIVNLRPKPIWLDWAPDWAWASRFPHNVVRQGAYIPGCGGDYCNQLVDPVFPTSLYESVVCVLLFLLLWGLRRRIRRDGVLFAIYALLIGAERFAVECIRINPLHRLFGLDLSQAQWISLAWMGIGLVTLFATTFTTTSSCRNLSSKNVLR
jgi:phosphatidylglycerol---prolipoprotein diacylglyceryl transferase